MLSASPRTLLASAFVLASLLAAACGSGGSSGDGGSPTPEASPADAGAIRALDFATLPAVQTLIRQIGGGELNRNEVQYADLTGDARDEAIVPIASGGTLGNLGYIVLTLKGGAPEPILTVTRDRNSVGGVTLAVEDGTLVKYVGRYGPTDPLCCPMMLLRTEYRWDGTALQVAGETEVAPNQSPKLQP